MEFNFSEMFVWELKLEKKECSKKTTQLIKTSSLKSLKCFSHTLWDLLWHYFRETDAFINKGDKQRETDEDGNPLTRQVSILKYLDW